MEELGPESCVRQGFLSAKWPSLFYQKWGCIPQVDGAEVQRDFPLFNYVVASLIALVLLSQGAAVLEKEGLV